MVQGIRICLPMQGTQVESLVQEDPTFLGATAPLRHNYRTRDLEPMSRHYWSPLALELVLCNKRSHFFLGMCWSPVCPGPQGWLRGLGKPNCQDLKQPPSHLGGWVSSRLWLLCPSGQCLEPTAPKRALGRQSQWPSLTCPSWPAGLGSCALACQYLLPPYVLSSGPAGLPPLPPGLVPPIPSRPSLDHPGQPWDQACTAGAVPSARTPPYPTLRRSGLGLECTGSCPWFFFSDREINFPLRGEKREGEKPFQWETCTAQEE